MKDGIPHTFIATNEL